MKLPLRILALVFVAILITITLGMGKTHAEEDAEGLTMEVRACFETYLRPGCYYPIKVTIENTGPDREGQIRVISQKPGQPLTAIFTSECDLPANSKKTYYLYPYVLNGDSTPAFYVQYVEDDPILTRSIDNLFPLDDYERLWVEVADEGPDFGYLSREQLPGESTFRDIASYYNEEQGSDRGSGMGGYRTSGSLGNVELPAAEPVMVWTRPENLPDRPEGYQSVDGLILNTRRYYELTQVQKVALTEWIISGGMVIVWLGDDPSRYQGSFLTGAVDGSGWAGPSAITDQLLRTTLPMLHTIPGFTGNQDVVSGFQATYTTQASARSLLAEGNTPVLQHLTFGRGDILLSGIDLSALKTIASDGLDEYISFMMGYLMSVDDRPRPTIRYEPGSPYGRWATTASDAMFVPRSLYRTFAEIDNVIQSDKLTALPTFNAIALFLVIYIILVGPVNYLILLKLRHREWLWYTIPVVVAIFIIGSYSWVASVKERKLLLTRINIVDVYPDTQIAWESSWFGLFSPAGKRYDIELRDNHDLIRELELPSHEFYFSGGFQATQTEAGLTLVQDGEGNRAYVDDAFIRIWSELHFETEGTISSPGSVTLENLTLDNTTRNSSGTLNFNLNYAIESPSLIYFARDGFVCKSLLPAGNTIQTGSVDFELDFLLDWEGTTPGSMMYSTADSNARTVGLRRAAFNAFTRRPLQNSGEDEIILVGWRSDGGGRPLGSPTIRSSTEETMILFHIPLVINEGSINLMDVKEHFIGLQAEDVSIGGSGELVLEDGWVLYCISLPQIDSSVRFPESLRVEVLTSFTGDNFSMQAFDHFQGAWGELQNLRSSQDQATFRIGSPNRFLAPDGRTLLLRITDDPDIPGEVISLINIDIYGS